MCPPRARKGTEEGRVFKLESVRELQKTHTHTRRTCCSSDIKYAQKKISVFSFAPTEYCPIIIIYKYLQASFCKKEKKTSPQWLSISTSHYCYYLVAFAMGKNQKRSLNDIFIPNTGVSGPWQKWSSCENCLDKTHHFLFPSCPYLHLSPSLWRSFGDGRLPDSMSPRRSLKENHCDIAQKTQHYRCKSQFCMNKFHDNFFFYI